MDSKQVSSGDKRRPPNAGKGRKKGSQNKLTRTVKEAFEAAFNALQDQPGAKLDDWAKGNPTDFYKIASKLIPTDVKATVEGSIEFREVVRKIVKP